MSPRRDRFAGRWKHLMHPAMLVGWWLECAGQEQFHRDLIARDDTGPAADRLRCVFSERQEAWLQGASWLAQLQASKGKAADEEVLWSLVDRWACRAHLEHLGEQAPVWASMSGDLAVALMMRGSPPRRNLATPDPADLPPTADGKQADQDGADAERAWDAADGEDGDDADESDEADESAGEEPEWGS